MQIVADENIPRLEAFARHGQVIALPGRQITAADVRDADALIVRSVTSVDERLLRESRVRFVGTCTIGTDHLDTEYFAQQGIAWANAPGCNSRAVVEYVLGALVVLAERTQRPLAERCYGIVGVGEVGQRLANVLQGLGWRVLLCDPPRQQGRAAPSVAATCDAEFVDLPSIMQQCDVISVHTPLTLGGAWPTQHLLGKAELAGLKAGAWLINAARGAVVDNQALLSVLQQRPDLTAVLDVWEPEPALNPELAQHCALATPHIAGYSLDGKIRGTEMIYQAFCRQFFSATAQPLVYPEAEVQSITLAGELSPEGLLATLCRLVYDPRRDDAALRMTLADAAPARALAFDRLRKDYPVRRELPLTQVKLLAERDDLSRVLRALGMRV